MAKLSTREMDVMIAEMVIESIHKAERAKIITETQGSLLTIVLYHEFAKLEKKIAKAAR